MGKSNSNNDESITWTIARCNKVKNKWRGTIMDYSDIKTNIPSLDYVNKLKITQNYNQHAELYLSGLLKEENKDKYEQTIKSTKSIEIYTSEEKKKCLFKGIVQESSLKHQGDVYFIIIKGISYSYLMDINKKSCSFQNQRMSYRSIFKKVVSPYEGKVQDNISDSKNIEKMVVQYDETDWEFLKRLASHFNRGLIPDVTFDSPCIVFGIGEEYNVGTLDSFEFSIKKDLNQYRKISSNENDKFKEVDAIEYQMQSYDNYNVGSLVKYKEKNLYIKNKEIEIEKGLLIFQYTLASKEGIVQGKLWNKNIIGLSLKGKVVDVKNDKVNVSLEIDPKNNTDNIWDFQYTTMYAADGHAGWYCMPEKGDTVNIYFPSKEESEAVAINSIRNTGVDVNNSGDTSVKYFRTGGGKELRFSPDGITIACSNNNNKKTGEKNIIYIDLNDDSGITITSTKPINISSDSNLKLNAKKKIVISADEQISLKCKTSQIMLNEMVDISGKIVRIN